MKKTLKVVTALTFLGLAVNQTTALAVDYSDASVTGWVQRTVEHVRNSVTNSQYYVVQWGDTLWTISQALDVPTESLVGLNGIANPDLIIAGSVIYYNPEANTVTLDDRQGNVETVQADTHQQVAPETVPTEVMEEASQQPVNLSPVTEVREAPTASAAAAQAATQEVAQEPTVLPEEVEEPVVEEETVTPVEEVASEVNAPVSVEEPVTEAPAEEVSAPVVEEVVEEPTPAPAVEATPQPVVEEAPAAPAVEETPAPAASTGYQGIQSAAKEWIAQRESGGDYNAVNPSGRYIGRYQLTADYLNGDYSIENQERVADEYVKNRYGSWEAAKVFWEANGWY